MNLRIWHNLSIILMGFILLPLAVTAGPDLAEPGAAEWSVSDHAPAGVIAFAKTGFSEQQKKNGKAGFATTVTVQSPGPGKEAGYVELRGILPATVDLTPCRAVRIAYKFGEKLPEKTLGSAWLTLSDAFGPQGNSAMRDGIPLQADGAWHEEELAFYDF